MTNLKGAYWRVIASLLATAAASGNALASNANSSGGGMPWDAPLMTLLQSLQGPVVRFFIFTAVIVTGLGFAFGEQGSGFKKFMGVVFGIALVLGVSSFINNLFGAAF